MSALTRRLRSLGLTLLVSDDVAASQIYVFHRHVLLLLFDSDERVTFRHGEGGEAAILCSLLHRVFIKGCVCKLTLCRATALLQGITEFFLSQSVRYHVVTADRGLQFAGLHFLGIRSADCRHILTVVQKVRLTPQMVHILHRSVLDFGLRQRARRRKWTRADPGRLYVHRGM